MAAGALVEAVAGSVLEAAGEEASIARLRGLPWSYGAKEVCEFLAGVSVNLQPEAVTMLHNAAGEAFVTLSTAAQLTEVLQANHQQIGRRYVEVFSSTTAEKVAACERNRATMRDDAGYRGVLRMRGLPFTASAEDIVAFFGSPPTLQLANVHLMRKADGRSSGDAYAVFDTEEAAVEAMKYDKQKLGARWVDLFQSNKGELYSLTSLGGIMLGGADGNGELADAPRGDRTSPHQPCHLSDHWRLNNRSPLGSGRHDDARRGVGRGILCRQTPRAAMVGHTRRHREFPLWDQHPVRRRPFDEWT